MKLVPIAIELEMASNRPMYLSSMVSLISLTENKVAAVGEADIKEDGQLGIGRVIRRKKTFDNAGCGVGRSHVCDHFAYIVNYSSITQKKVVLLIAFL